MNIIINCHTSKVSKPTIGVDVVNRKRYDYEYNYKLSLVNPQECHQVLSIKG